MASRSKDFNFDVGEEGKEDSPRSMQGRLYAWTATELSTDEEEEEARFKYFKVQGKKKAVPPQPPTRRQQAIIDSGTKLHTNESEAQRAKDKERLKSYMVKGRVFNHARLSDDFYASGHKMYMLQQRVKEEAAALVGSKRPVYSGSTPAQLYKVAQSKFNELDRRVRSMHPLLMKSEGVGTIEYQSLTTQEWKDLRFEMIWIIGVRESYDGWDWKKDGTKR